jgi:hypothetical protein
MMQRGDEAQKQRPTRLTRGGEESTLAAMPKKQVLTRLEVLQAADTLMASGLSVSDLPEVRFHPRLGSCMPKEFATSAEKSEDGGEFAPQ